METVVALDVGANVGQWTLSFLQQAQSENVQNLAVHSFEPVPSTFQSLQQAISSHPMGHLAKLICQAVSEKHGDDEFLVYSDGGGTNAFYPDAMRPTVAERIHVKKTTISDYCDDNSIERIHLLKCDAEGHDLFVLEGAKLLFEASRIMVCQFEYNHRWVYSRRYLKDVFDFASDLPEYSVGKLSPNGIELFETWHPELERFIEGNYVLLLNQVSDQLMARKGSFDLHNTYDIAK